MLVIYDKADKKIEVMLHDETSLREFGSVLIDIPEGKELVGLTEDLEPIFEDRPLSVEERLAQLEESQADQDGAIEELAGLVTGEE